MTQLLLTPYARAEAVACREPSTENLDAIECIGHYDSPTTPYYLDPPYLPEVRSKWRKVAYRHEATPADHAQLATILQQIAGMAIVSGYPSRLYADLYAGWTCVTTATRTDRGVSVTESLWISPNAAQVIQASLFPSASEAFLSLPLGEL